MEIGNQAAALMGEIGEETKLDCLMQDGFSQVVGDLVGDKLDLVDAVIGEAPSPYGLAQNVTQESDTYCPGQLLRSPRSTFDFPK